MNILVIMLMLSIDSLEVVERSVLCVVYIFDNKEGVIFDCKIVVWEIFLIW